MPRKRSNTTSRRPKQAAALDKLRKAGLTRSQAGKRGKRPGGSAYAKLREFRDVIEGKAAVITAPPAVVKKYKGTFRTTKNKIVVPKSSGETVRLAKKRAQIVKTKIVTRDRPKIKLQIHPAVSTLRDLPQGPGYRYRIVTSSGVQTFESFAALKVYLDLAYPSKNLPYVSRYIEVIPPNKRNRR